MKAISLWQPWASAMALGLKRIETRHWSTNVRGPVAIHAAKRWTGEEREFAQDMVERYQVTELLSPPLGAIVAVGFLFSVHRTDQLLDLASAQEQDWGNYGPERFGWRFRDIVRLAEPIPFKGAQGFFDVPDEVLAGAPMPPELLPVVKAAPPPPRQRDMFREPDPPEDDTQRNDVAP